MEENKNKASTEEDLQEVVIEEPVAAEDNKKRLKRRVINLIYDVLILIGIGCLIYGGYSLYEGYRDSKEAEESHEQLKNDYVSVPVLPNTPNKPNNPNKPSNPTGSENEETQVPERPREWYEQIRVDLEGMQTNVNPDIIGWIHFENETISYPLLYSEDNAEYQRVRYDLVYSRGGSIFLEETNTWNLSDIRNVIYGHNMKDESMFGKLKYYNDKKDYYEDHQYFQLLYDGMVYRYQIFSYFTIHQTEVGYIDTNFEKGSDRYGEFLQKLVENSKKDTGVEVDANDKTVTLVTCSKDNTYRFIVSAVLVDQHTMANADGTFPEEPDTEPDTEPGTEPGTEPDTEPDDTEPDTEEPGTEDPAVRPGADNYTYSDIGKTMMATVSVKIRNKPSTEGVRIALLGKHDQVYVESVCNETGWYRVRYGTNGRKTGFINGKYLTEENLHLKNPVFGGTEQAHLKCGDCGEAISADHILVETTTETGAIVYVCECGYMTETPPAPTPDEPGTDEPGTDEPGTDEPGTDEPGTDEPGTDEPGTDEPGTDEPGTDEPGTDEPGTDEPGTDEPSTDEPGTDEPSTDEPSTDEPSTEEPSESESEAPGDEPSESESQSGSEEPSESESQDVSEEPSEIEKPLEPTE